jgi:hypothetical protein
MNISNFFARHLRGFSRRPHRGLFMLGGIFLISGFLYDCTFAGGFSWDDPPEITLLFERQMAVVDSIYTCATVTLGLGIVIFSVHLIRRVRPRVLKTND